MVDTLDRQRLTLEPVSHRFLDEDFCLDDLDRDLSLEALVVCPEDGPHGAFGDPVLQPVATGDPIREGQRFIEDRLIVRTDLYPLVVAAAAPSTHLEQVHPTPEHLLGGRTSSLSSFSEFSTHPRELERAAEGDAQSR